MKYLVLESTDLDSLEKKVNDYISSGYSPIGGIAVHGRDNGGIDSYAQAMVWPTEMEMYQNRLKSGEKG